MSQYRIPRSDLCIVSDSMAFNSHYEARVPVAIVELGDIGTALQAGYSELRPGDQVNICSFERIGNDWRKLKEMVTVRIAERDLGQRRLEVVQVGEVFKVPAKQRSTQSGLAPSFLHVVQSGGGWEVQDTLGNVIEMFVDEPQAIEFADRENARLPPGKPGERSVKRSFGGYEVRDEKGAVLKQFKTKAEAEEFAGLSPVA